MSDLFRVIPLVSVAALALALGQPLRAEPAADAPPPPVAPATAAAPVAPTAGPADAHRAEMDAERNKRYAELRANAAEVGLQLPETPPWESGMPQMLPPPAMPDDYRGPSAQEWEAMRKEREALREKIKNMTPQEREAMREERWKKMRERAAERGIEMPETPPWKEAEARYQASQEQFEKYRKTVDAMTEEQQEAARALFGCGGQRPPRPMRPMGGYGPQGGYPGYGPYQGGPGPMQPPMPYFEGGDEPLPLPGTGPAPKTPAPAPAPGAAN
jgi:hypothetical protein